MHARSLSQPRAASGGVESGSLPSRAVAWSGVAILTLIYACSFVDRQIMALLVGPIRNDLAITDTGLSLLHGFAFAVLYATCGLPIGRWVDRGDRRHVLMTGVLVWSAFTVLCGMARNFTQLFACRIGVGVGEATVVPTTYSLLAEYFSRERRGVAMATFGVGVYAGFGLAMIIGGVVVNALADMHPVSLPAIGTLQVWQVAFLVVGLPGVPLALLALALYEPRKNQHASRSRAKTPWQDLGCHLRGAAGAIFSHHLATALLAMALYGALAWGPEFFRRSFGIASGFAGIRIGFVVLIAGTAGILIGGAISDWLLRRGNEAARLLTLLWAALGAAPFAVLFGLADSGSAALAALGGAVFFLAMLTAAGPAGVQELYPPSLRGIGAALFQLIVTLIGLGVGPTAVALVSDSLMQDGTRLGESMAYALPIMLLAAALAAAAGLRPYRRAMRAAGCGEIR